MSTAIYLDTNVFISAFESATPRADQMWMVFEALSAGEFVGVTSELTLAELLPKPLSLGQTELSEFYATLLSGSETVAVAPISRRILMESATLRARHPTLKLPDAVHLATAADQECSILLSDDRRIPLSDGMQVVHLGAHTLDELRRLDA